MLYVTTRNDRQTFTAQYVLKNDRGPDGGLFMPYHAKCFSGEDAAKMLQLPFDQCIAEVLNRLLDAKLTGWDVSFHIGRYPVRMRRIGHRTIIAEAWHNPDWTYERLVKNLAAFLTEDDHAPAQWVKVAVSVAVIVGICGELKRSGSDTAADFAMVSGDFTVPISAWLARSWGFPIGNILCCCNENGNLWDLISNGQMRTDGISVPTDTPEADVVLPDSLERLIYACGGAQEVQRYQDCCQAGGTYIPPDALLGKLCKGLYVSVVGRQRVEQSIPRVFASRNYLLSPYDALCYCGVSDYRTRYGETGHVVILSRHSPRCSLEATANAMGVSEEEIIRLL